MNTSAARGAIAALIASLAGCLAEVEPEVGALNVAVCEPEDSDPEHDVSFENDVFPLFDWPGSEGGCSCHMPTSRRAVGIELSGLNLGSRTALLRGGNQSGAEIVVPGDPCASILVQKVSPAPPFGARMPSSGPPYMTPRERALLSDWIAEGARDN